MRVATHTRPAWRDRANFLIRALLPEDGEAERLWARQISATTFEVCCIPFFTYDLALGDVVETDTDYRLSQVLERSGRQVIRVWFGGADPATPTGPVADTLLTLGATIEWSSAHLLAVDAESPAIHDAVWRYLETELALGRLTFEQAAPQLDRDTSVGRW